MRKVSKLAFLLFMGLILASTAMLSSQAVPELLIDATVIDNEILFNEVAKYQLELTNNREATMNINLPTPRNNWDITINPYLFELREGQSKIVDISIAPPKVVDSGVYSVYFKFNANNEQIDYKYLHVEVLEDSPVFDSKIKLIEEIKAEESWSEEFLERSYTVVLINTGKGETSGIWNTEVSSFGRFFLKSDIPSVFETTEGVTKINWEYTIPVGEQVTLTYSIYYMPLFAASIFILIALILLGIYYMSPYKVTKSITTKGGYIQVKIYLKNKTRKKQENITVEDYIPVPLMLSRSFGTMSPTSIRKYRSKLTVTWKFDELAPKEERLLSYKMKSKLKVEGRINIPPATLNQKTKKKKVQIYSKIKHNE